MKEDKNMEMINKLTLLRAKQERQRKMQAKQHKVKKIKNQVNEIYLVNPVEEEKIDKPVEEKTKKKRVVSEETKEKIRQKMLGKKHSAETIDKIKEIRLLKYARSVTCVTTGEMFDSVNRAAYYYGIHSSNIVQCCKGKLKHTGKLDGTPLEWQYTTDYLNNKQH